jgi:hypothetical protein
MKATSLWICLYGLCGLLVVGCTPTETAPLSVTRPIAQTTVTDTLAPTLTTTPAATAAAINTPPPSPTATPTPDPPLPAWTREPSPTPTITASPTPTPWPGPIWRIYFKAKSCPDNSLADSYGCSLGAASLDYTESQAYFINNDGSSFTPLTESHVFLANLDYFALPRYPFSAGNEYIAYETLDCIYISDLSGDKPICMIPKPNLGRGFEFWAGTNCLITYILSPEVSHAQVSLEKVCPGDIDPEVITVVDFPDLLHTSSYHLSPQGDALLGMGFVENEIRLYIQELEIQAQPQLLFPHPDLSFPVTWPIIRWQPDGEAIDLFFTREAATFVTISRDDSSIVQGIILNDFYPFGGTWSPDGTEFVFSHAEVDADKSGLYVINLQSGEWRQILSGYTTGIAGNIRTWINDMP